VAVDPNIVNEVMCPIRSGVDLMATPNTNLAGIASDQMRINIIPKRAPCMKDCAFFDKANNQCYGLTVAKSLASFGGGFGGLFGGKP
jgi:hypothetical protein